MNPIVIKISLTDTLENQLKDIEYRLTQAWGLQNLKHHIYCGAKTYFFLEPMIDKLNYRPAKFLKYRIFIDQEVPEGELLLG